MVISSLNFVRKLAIIKKMPIKAALIDLSGTLHVEDEATPNAVEALKKLRTTGICIRFVTNTTKESSQTLYQRLCEIGFELEKNEIYSSLSAAAGYVLKNQLNPFYLLSTDARTDFPANNEEKEYDSVVIGLAPEEFNYEKLNKAMNVLLADKKHHLIAVHQGRYYKRKDGLALGPGCFVKGLEFCTGTKPLVIGKPNPFFFNSAIPEGIQPEECVMIGDDVNDDIVGAMGVGFQGLLVKTGKYLPNVEMPVPPTAVLENFSEAVEWIIKHK